MIELRVFLFFDGGHTSLFAVGADVMEVDLGIGAVDPGELVFHPLAAFHGKPQQLFDLASVSPPFGKISFNKPGHCLVDGIAIAGRDLLADLEILIRPVREIF